MSSFLFQWAPSWWEHLCRRWVHCWPLHSEPLMRTAFQEATGHEIQSPSIMSSLVQAPALFLSIRFLIISASYKKHICPLKGNMVTKKSFLYSFSLTWTLGFNWRIKCIMYDTFHNYCWWFCERRWAGGLLLNFQTGHRLGDPEQVT